MFAHQFASFCNCIRFISTTVMFEPFNVTVCEGRSTSFTCVFNSSITSDDVQWYRLLKDTGTTERIGRLDDFTVVPIASQNSFSISLYIFIARSSYTGYYWVRLPLGEVCNEDIKWYHIHKVVPVSYLTVTTGICICCI